MSGDGRRDYADRIDRRLAALVPPRASWTPVDEAVYGPADPFRVPPGEAEALQLAALRHAFARHFAGNATYRRWCEAHGFSPSSIRGPADLDRVPLLPAGFFKGHPPGRGLALWLAGVTTGELPRVTVRGRRPSVDAVVGAFNAAGMRVCYSSGTSGRLTLVPRDLRTFRACQYAAAKAALSMAYPHWRPEVRGCLLMPDPRRTDLFAGKVCTVYFDAFDEVLPAMRGAVGADDLLRVMGGGGGVRGRFVRLAARAALRRVVARAARWVVARHRAGEPYTLLGAPHLAAAVLDRLEAAGGLPGGPGRGMVVTGGGWKNLEATRVPHDAFRERVRRVLGVPPERCLDVYGMVESNAWMAQCPEGHFLHVPAAQLRPLVLDGEGRPLGPGVAGRFAFLDAAAWSHPGFVVTDDVVTLRERCPACDRPGPVLEPEVRRVDGGETRGCAEEVRRVLAIDAAGGGGGGA